MQPFGFTCRAGFPLKVTTDATECAATADLFASNQEPAWWILFWDAAQQRWEPLRQFDSAADDWMLTEAATSCGLSVQELSLLDLVSARTPCGGQLASLFEQWWACLPKQMKVGKKAAEKAFGKLQADDSVVKRMIAAVLAQSAHKSKLAEAGAFCPNWPNAATWINGERWNDELAEPSNGQPSYDGLKRFAQKNGSR